MTPTFHFDIVTLNGKEFSGEVQSLIVPGERGLFGVLANHAAMISLCAAGKLKIRDSSGNEKFFSTGPGYFEVRKNQAVLLTQSAVPAATN